MLNVGPRCGKSEIEENDFENEMLMLRSDSLRFLSIRASGCLRKSGFLPEGMGAWCAPCYRRRLSHKDDAKI